MTQPNSSPVTRGLEGQLHMAWGSRVTTTPTPPPPQPHLWDGSVSNSYRPSPVGPQQGSFRLVLLVPLEPGRVWFRSKRKTPLLISEWRGMNSL